MSRKSAIFLTAALVSAGLIANPLAAEAGGMSRIGTMAGNAALKAVLNCGGVTMGGAIGAPQIFAPVTVNQNANQFGPAGGKAIIVNKPITIQTNIDASKNINIDKNVNINVNTNTNITAVTDKSAGNSTSTIYASSNFDSGAIGVGGGDIAVHAVEAAADHAAKGGQCNYVDTTVVKAIHAICVSADNREFPASHMVGASWIASGYEGELARCLPGSTLKVMIGSVVQSDQGMATSMRDAQILTCGAHQAMRHYKDGMLKCAPADKVVDCTERTNLRKWGTGDMFFSYVAKVCLDQIRVGGQSRESADQAAARARAAWAQDSGTGYSYGSADKAIILRSQNMPRNSGH